MPKVTQLGSKELRPDLRSLHLPHPSPPACFLCNFVAVVIYLFLMISERRRERERRIETSKMRIIDQPPSALPLLGIEAATQECDFS